MKYFPQFVANKLPIKSFPVCILSGFAAPTKEPKAHPCHLSGFFQSIHFLVQALLEVVFDGGQFGQPVRVGSQIGYDG